METESGFVMQDGSVRSLNQQGDHYRTAGVKETNLRVGGKSILKGGAKAWRQND